MKQSEYTILSNRSLTATTYEMIIRGDTTAIKNPGQFINISVPKYYLRRPISICDYDNNKITIIYKVVGNGTKDMSTFEPGEKLDVLCGLGNGFDTSVSGDYPLLIGGGVGLPPMYNLAKKLISEGKHPSLIMGFNTKDEIFYLDEFRKLGIPVYVTTVDGSEGIRGFVTDAFSEIPEYSYFYTCGPEPMLKAIFRASATSGQLSLEQRMGCGFGACMGCSYMTKNGYKRICKEGPVLVKEELLW